METDVVSLNSATPQDVVDAGSNGKGPKYLIVLASVSGQYKRLAQFAIANEDAEPEMLTELRTNVPMARLLVSKVNAHLQREVVL